MYCGISNNEVKWKPGDLDLEHFISCGKIISGITVVHVCSLSCVSLNDTKHRLSSGIDIFFSSHICLDYSVLLFSVTVNTAETH